jgi:hypothetical protein
MQHLLGWAVAPLDNGLHRSDASGGGSAQDDTEDAEAVVPLADDPRVLEHPDRREGPALEVVQGEVGDRGQVEPGEIVTVRKAMERRVQIGPRVGDQLDAPIWNS